MALVILMMTIMMIKITIKDKDKKYDKDDMTAGAPPMKLTATRTRWRRPSTWPI